MVQYGISTTIAQDPEFEPAMRMIAASGCQLVEMSSAAHHIDTILTDVQRAKELLAELGLTAPTGHGPSRLGDDPAALNEKDRIAGANAQSEILGVGVDTWGVDFGLLGRGD